MKIILSSKERDAVDRLLYAISVESGGGFMDLDRAVTKAGGTWTPGMGQTEVAFSEKLTIAAVNAITGAVKIGFNVGKTVFAMFDVTKGALQNIEHKFLQEMKNE